MPKKRGMRTVITSAVVATNVSSGGGQPSGWADYTKLARAPLGRGAFKTVWKVQHTATRETYALAEMAVPDERQRAYARAEVAALLSIDHANIVKMHSVFEFVSRDGVPTIAMVLEYVPHTLYSVLTTLASSEPREQLSEARARTFLCGLCRGAQALHERGQVHRDIKPDNIFVSETGLVKLGDLGLVKGVDSLVSPTGHMLWAAPEYFLPQTSRQQERNKITQLSDVWSIGCVLLDMTCDKMMVDRGQVPLGLTVLQAPAARRKMLVGKLVLEMKARGYSSELTDTVSSCLNVQQHQRPSAGEIVAALEPATGDAAGDFVVQQLEHFLKSHGGLPDDTSPARGQSTSNAPLPGSVTSERSPSPTGTGEAIRLLETFVTDAERGLLPIDHEAFSRESARLTTRGSEVSGATGSTAKSKRSRRVIITRGKSTGRPNDAQKGDEVAARKAAASAAAEIATCTICCRFYTDKAQRVPRLLNCYHTFCHECITAMSVDYDVKCPQCSKVTQLPGGVTNSLPRNFAMQDVAAAAKEMIQRSSDPTQVPPMISADHASAKYLSKPVAKARPSSLPTIPSVGARSLQTVSANLPTAVVGTPRSITCLALAVFTFSVVALIKTSADSEEQIKTTAALGLLCLKQNGGCDRLRSCTPVALPAAVRCGRCPAGWTELGSVYNCSDVNECAQRVTHECARASTTCYNTRGSFGCTCKLGFSGNSGTSCGACAAGTFKSLAGDQACAKCTSPCGQGLFEVAPCSPTTDRKCGACPRGEFSKSGVCVKCTAICSSGSERSQACNATHDLSCAACSAGKFSLVAGQLCQGCAATCSAGYAEKAACTALTDRTCVDIDECAASFSPRACDINASCTNKIGAFSCKCLNGLVGTGLTCSSPWALLRGNRNALGTVLSDEISVFVGPPVTLSAGSRRGAARWTVGDATYVFGGVGHTHQKCRGGDCYLNDLWRWSESAQIWTCVGGGRSNNLAGVYSGGAVWPGARESAVATVSAGILLLFSGVGYGASTSRAGPLNDCFAFNVTSERWSFCGGSDAVDSSGAANQPSSRESACSWSDSKSLWVFGGKSRATYLGDLWKMSLATKKWTAIASSAASYDSGGTWPPARSGSECWKDALGNFWLGFGRGAKGYCQDLWRYDQSRWRWQSGSASINIKGQYSGKAAQPGGRQHAMSVTVGDGKILLFGGDGYDSEGKLGYLADLWLWSGASTPAWQWMGGCDTAMCAALGEIKTWPTSRKAGTAWFAGGKLYLFGGEDRVGYRFGSLWAKGVAQY